MDTWCAEDQVGRKRLSTLISPTWRLWALGTGEPVLLQGKWTVSQGRHSHSYGNQIPLGPVMPHPQMEPFCS